MNKIKNINISSLKSNASRLFGAGLFHIFGSNFLNNIIAFVNQMLLVKMISQVHYGLYTSAFNIVGYALVLSGLGINQGLMQYCSETDDEEKHLKYYKFGIKFSVIFNLTLSFLLLLYTFVGPIKYAVTRPYIRFLFLFPLFDILFQLAAVWLRIKRKNKEYSLLLNIDSISYMVGTLVCACFWGWQGALLSRYFSRIVSLLYFFKNNSKSISSIKSASKIEDNIKKEIIKYSMIICFSNMASILLYLVDITIIASVTNAQSLAIYTAMTKIPNALAFIPLSKLYDFSYIKNSSWKFISYV